MFAIDLEAALRAIILMWFGALWFVLAVLPDGMMDLFFRVLAIRVDGSYYPLFLALPILASLAACAWATLIVKRRVGMPARGATLAR